MQSTPVPQLDKKSPLTTLSFDDVRLLVKERAKYIINLSLTDRFHKDPFPYLFITDQDQTHGKSAGFIITSINSASVKLDLHTISFESEKDMAGKQIINYISGDIATSFLEGILDPRIMGD